MKSSQNAKLTGAYKLGWAECDRTRYRAVISCALRFTARGPAARGSKRHRRDDRLAAQPA